MKKFKDIRIQPEELEDMTLPYPFFIEDKSGKVGRQDFWKGHPSKLVGFSKNPVSGKIDLSLIKFIEKPSLCRKMFPVFENKDGGWWTSTVKIDNVSVVD